MPCHEQELIEVLRRLVADSDSDGAKDEAVRLLERIDEEEEAIRRERDPYGDDYRGV